MSPSFTLSLAKPQPSEAGSRQLRTGRGRPPKPVVACPEALWPRLDTPGDFAAVLDAEIRRHGDSVWGLHRAMVAVGGTVDRTTLGTWR